MHTTKNGYFMLSKKDMQCTFNETWRRVRATIVVVEKH